MAGGAIIFNPMVKYNDRQLDTVFSALSDPTRRAILEKLTHGPLSVTALAEPFSISIPAVSKHLSVLNDAGLIEMEKDGRIHRMHLRSKALREAAAWLDHYAKFWNERFDGLELFFKRTKAQPPKRHLP